MNFKEEEKLVLKNEINERESAHQRLIEIRDQEIKELKEKFNSTVLEQEKEFLQKKKENLK